MEKPFQFLVVLFVAIFYIAIYTVKLVIFIIKFIYEVVNDSKIKKNKKKRLEGTLIGETNK